jgi:hypothetical protein
MHSPLRCLITFSAMGISLVWLSGCGSGNHSEPKPKLTGRIFFTSIIRDKFSVQIINADGTNQKQLTDKDYSDIDSSTSSDGSKFLVAGSKIQPLTSNLYIFVRSYGVAPILMIGLAR